MRLCIRTRHQLRSLVIAWKFLQQKTVLNTFGLIVLHSLNASDASFTGNEMNVKRLIELLTNRVNSMRNELNIATAMGDIERVLALEAEILSTEQTIAQLQSL